MLAHLRSVGPGFGHELARAMLVSAAFFLRETFGQEHALGVAASLVPPVLGVGMVPTLPAEVTQISGEAPTEAPAVTLH